MKRFQWGLMRFLAGVPAAAAALLLSASPVSGDDMGIGRGILLAYLPAVVCLEIGIVVAEAVAYRLLLQLDSRRAVGISLGANGASILAGLPIAGALWNGPPVLDPVIVNWGIPAIVTLAVEVPVVLLMARSYPDRFRLGRVAFGLNLATWSVGTALLYMAMFAGPILGTAVPLVALMVLLAVLRLLRTGAPMSDPTGRGRTRGTQP